MNTKLFQTLAKAVAERAKTRETLINDSNKALTRAKRAIFAFHRADEKKAKAQLAESKKLLSHVQSTFKKIPSLEYEGSYRAALEEYAEALLYQGFLQGDGAIDLDDKYIGHETYIGALSDATGEVVRWATLRATEGKIESVRDAEKFVREVIDFLLSMDLTGYLRNKSDQAKKNMQSIEKVLYDLSLR